MILKTFTRSHASLEGTAAVYVPTGLYVVGSDRPDESPPALVSLREFWIGQDAVTNEQFGWFVRSGGYVDETLWTAEALQWLRDNAITEPAFWRDARFNAPQQPVTGVSFYEAQTYARWFGGRLATEVEWEAAGRGPDARTYPWGETPPTRRLANFAPGFVPVHRASSAVGRFRRNISPFGCRQLAGNVFEWCADFYHFDTPKRRAAGLAVEERPSGRRVLKGGAWTTDADRIRLAARWSYTPDLRDNIIGFRLVFDDQTQRGSSDSNETSHLSDAA